MRWLATHRFCARVAPALRLGSKLDHALTLNEVECRNVTRDVEANMGLPGLIRTAVLIGMGTLWLLVA